MLSLCIFKVRGLHHFLYVRQSLELKLLQLHKMGQGDALHFLWLVINYLRISCSHFLKLDGRF